MHSYSIEDAVEQVLAQLPAHIHMGLPLGLGKPNRFVNALYARVRELPERRLTIYTALTLGRPDLGDGLHDDLGQRAAHGAGVAQEVGHGLVQQPAVLLAVVAHGLGRPR